MTQHTKHTPGPWMFRPSRQPQITSESDPAGRTIAIVYDQVPDAERKANASLIAAAPELLEALKECLGELERLGWGGAGYTDLAHAAIAKAEG